MLDERWRAIETQTSPTSEPPYPDYEIFAKRLVLFAKLSALYLLALFAIVLIFDLPAIGASHTFEQFALSPVIQLSAALWIVVGLLFLAQGLLLFPAARRIPKEARKGYLLLVMGTDPLLCAVANICFGVGIVLGCAWYLLATTGIVPFSSDELIIGVALVGFGALVTFVVWNRSIHQQELSKSTSEQNAQ